MRTGSQRGATAYGAEVVLDLFLAELVSGEVAFRRAEMYLGARDKPAQCAQPATDRTIALRHTLQVSFDLKRDVSTVTASFVNHVAPLFSP